MFTEVRIHVYRVALSQSNTPSTKKATATFLFLLPCYYLVCAHGRSAVSHPRTTPSQPTPRDPAAWNQTFFFVGPGWCSQTPPQPQQHYRHFFFSWGVSTRNNFPWLSTNSIRMDMMFGFPGNALITTSTDTVSFVYEIWCPPSHRSWIALGHRAFMLHPPRKLFFLQKKKSNQEKWNYDKYIGW